MTRALFTIALLLAISLMVLCWYDEIVARKAKATGRKSLDQALTVWMEASEAASRMNDIDEDVLSAAADRVTAIRRERLLDDLKEVLGRPGL